MDLPLPDHLPPPPTLTPQPPSAPRWHWCPRIAVTQAFLHQDRQEAVIWLEGKQNHGNDRSHCVCSSRYFVGLVICMDTSRTSTSGTACPLLCLNTTESTTEAAVGLIARFVQNKTQVEPHRKLKTVLKAALYPLWRFTNWLISDSRVERFEQKQITLVMSTLARRQNQPAQWNKFTVRGASL